MPATIFVDTNVLVYARDAAFPQKQAIAQEWMERLWRDQSGRTSMQVLSELYVTLTRKLRPGLSAEDAWDDIETLFTWDPMPVNRDLLARAHEIETRYHVSWWDAMVVAAAELQSCATLLSEDMHNGMRFGQVTVRNPFRPEVEEAAADYTTDIAIPSRHRPRGRPRQRPTRQAL